MKLKKKYEVPGHSASEIYRKVAMELRAAVGGKSFMKDITLNYNDPETRIELKSKYADAILVCLPGRVEVDAKLAMMALPFKGKIEKFFDEWAHKLFPKT